MSEFAVHTLWAKLNGVWTNISSDLIGQFNADWGLMGVRETDRTAKSGDASLIMNNFTLPGKYSFDHSDRLSGWSLGTEIKSVFFYNGELIVRFKGVVTSSKNFGPQNIFKKVTVVDWLEYASTQPIDNPGFFANKTGDQVLDEVLSLMPIQPDNTDFDTGVNTFPTVFDTVTSTTKAMDEFVKVALSELGMVYLRKDKVYGETLVFENAYARNGLRSLSTIPALGGSLLLQGGGYQLLQGGGKRILNSQTSLHLEELDITDWEVLDGENITNRFMITALPRSYDASDVTLFTLNESLVIGSGQTITLKGTYADPNGGLPVNVNPDDMVTPVATTHYLANTVDGGGGTNFTADLVVTPSWGTNGFTHTIFNNSAYDGYVYFFICVGKGIYKHNPIEHVASDSVSIAAYGTSPGNLTQKYKNDLIMGSLFADMVVDDGKQPENNLVKIQFCANKTSSSMLSFLNLDIGDLVWLTQAQDEIDGYYFIQAVKYMTDPGNLIMCTWLLKQFFSVAAGLSLLAAEFALTSTDAINYGYIPSVSNAYIKRTISVWIYAHTEPVGTGDMIFSVITDNSGALISLTTSSQINFYQKGLTAPGGWLTDIDTVTLNQWINVVISRDAIAAANYPITYIDGVAMALTEVQVQGGVTLAELGAPVIIGNWKTATEDYSRSFDGKIADVRVYDRILTASEAAQIHTEGIGGTGVTDGLIFQGPAVKTKRLASYVDAVLTGTMKLKDAIHGYVGTPHGSPVGRALP